MPKHKWSTTPQILHLVGNSHRHLNMYKTLTKPPGNKLEWQWHNRKTHATRIDPQPPNRHFRQVHRSVYNIETKCKERRLTFLLGSSSFSRLLGGRRSITRDYWRRSSSKKDESKKNKECEAARTEACVRGEWICKWTGGMLNLNPWNLRLVDLRGVRERTGS